MRQTELGTAQIAVLEAFHISRWRDRTGLVAKKTSLLFRTKIDQMNTEVKTNSANEFRDWILC